MPSSSDKKQPSTSKKKSASKKKVVAKKKTTKTPKTTKKKATDSKRAAEPRKSAVAKNQKLRVRQVRSGIGHAGVFRRTLIALGLKHHQDAVVLPDNPSVRGMLRKVNHLVSVKPEE